MADANAVIRDLGQQVAQLTVDKAILTAELAEANERNVDLTAALNAEVPAVEVAE
jgi:hypothetical protein